MRKADIKVGEHYAVGSTSLFDRWRLVEMEVVELSGSRPGQSYRAPKKGIVVRRVTDSTSGGGSFYSLYAGAAGTEFVVTGREVIQPWSTYESRLRELNEKSRRREEEADRVRQVSKQATEELSAHGFGDGIKKTSFHSFVIHPDTMLEIARRMR